MSSDPAPSRTFTEVDALAGRHLDAVAALDPVFATETGLAAHAERLTDYSPSGHAARADQARATLAALGALDPVDEVDRVTIAALRERCEQTVAAFGAGIPLGDLNNISCPVQLVREVFDLSATATVDDWEAIAARLHAVPAAMAGYQQSLDAARRAGWAPAVRQVLAVARQAGEFGAPHGFFGPFAEQATLGDGARPPAALRRRLDQGADRASRAYGAMEIFLQEHQLPSARPDDAVGREVYAITSRGFLGAAIDLDETYGWALEELDRIEQRMVDISARIVPGPVPAGAAAGRALVDAAVEALDGDPGRTVHGAAAFMDWMQDLSDRAVGALAGTHFDIPERLRRLSAGSPPRPPVGSTTPDRRRTSPDPARCGGRYRPR